MGRHSRPYYKKSNPRTEKPEAEGGRWASRSGVVVVRRVGDDKAPLPPPSRSKRNRQDKWL